MSVANAGAVFIIIAVGCGVGLSIYLSQLSPRSAYGLKAIIGAVSAPILIWYILTSTDHSWIATTFAFFAVGITIDSLWRYAKNDPSGETSGTSQDG